MKRDMDRLNLRDAFAKEPKSCHEALMAAARSVKEDEPVKKNAMRTVLVAALMILAMMTVAVAAGNFLGWTDFFADYGTTVPEGAQRTMGDDKNRLTFTLGPVGFTTQELFCDGHIAMASTVIDMVDRSDALLCADPYDAVGAIGENGKQMAKRLGVDPSTSWISAAKQLNRKLYAVRAILEVPADIDSGTAMEDLRSNEDGSAVYFSMPQLNGSAKGDAVDAQLFLRVAEFNTETGEEAEVLTDRKPLSIPLEAPAQEHIYAIDGEFATDGYVLEGVRAELSGAGLYLYTTFTAPKGTTEEGVYGREYPMWLDAAGNRYPVGLSLSANVDVESFPKITYEQMISVSDIPETLTLRVPDVSATMADGGKPAYQQITLNK